MPGPIIQLPPIKSTEMQARTHGWVQGLSVIGSPIRPPAVPLDEETAQTPRRPRTMAQMLADRVNKQPIAGPETPRPAISRPSPPRQPVRAPRTPETAPVRVDEGLSRGPALLGGMAMFRKKK